jgi:DNA adenine methylase
VLDPGALPLLRRGGAVFVQQPSVPGAALSFVLRQSTGETMKAPFPWFGGKSRIASEVWRRFGNTPNYVEPFAGSLAVLLERPHDPHIETVNDKDCFLANFWRALQQDPEGVTHWADWPVSEADLHARHWWLVRNTEFIERMHTDPDYFDVKVAGWWVWGICQWIGSGWCEYPEWQQLPHLGNAGRGINRPHQKRPHLASGKGMNRQNGDLLPYLTALSDRLRRVRICAGDWSRVLGPTVTEKQGLTAIFLDPPYSDKAGRDGSLYAVEDLSVAHAVREWALANGDNPLLRIALCGYEGEHDIPDTWECLEWATAGGYSSQGSSADINRHKERVWFSPHCLQIDKHRQLSYLDIP